ncbi:uncharacterized protein LOC131437273 [Malaya genurostris]|uniref:uncharacterized protein LOC131437273 n=1 Tax=Malaya genurostris TaxID=325434 RepID=UPI0026F3CF1A|nr:uncharacterized protein LOC131437273 [Malaya genurostris]
MKLPPATQGSTTITTVVTSTETLGVVAAIAPAMEAPTAVTGSTTVTTVVTSTETLGVVADVAPAMEAPTAGTGIEITTKEATSTETATTVRLQAMIRSVSKYESPDNKTFTMFLNARGSEPSSDLRITSAIEKTKRTTKLTFPTWPSWSPRWTMWTPRTTSYQLKNLTTSSVVYSDDGSGKDPLGFLTAVPSKLNNTIDSIKMTSLLKVEKSGGLMSPISIGHSNLVENSIEPSLITIVPTENRSSDSSLDVYSTNSAINSHHGEGVIPKSVVVPKPRCKKMHTNSRPKFHTKIPIIVSLTRSEQLIITEPRAVPVTPLIPIFPVVKLRKSPKTLSGRADYYSGISVSTSRSTQRSNTKSGQTSSGKSNEVLILMASILTVIFF